MRSPALYGIVPTKYGHGILRLWDVSAPLRGKWGFIPKRGSYKGVLKGALNAVLKGVLKRVLEGSLIKWPGPLHAHNVPSVYLNGFSYSEWVRTWQKGKTGGMLTSLDDFVVKIAKRANFNRKVYKIILKYV